MALVSLVSACGDSTSPAPTRTAVPLVADTFALALSPVSAPTLLAIVNESRITDSSSLRVLASTRRQLWSNMVRTTLLADGADSMLTVGRSVAFEVNAWRRLVFVGTHRSVSSSGTVSWSGAMQGGIPGTISLTWSAGYGVSGNIVVLADHSYQYWVTSLGNGWHAITYVDPSRIPLD